MTGLMHGGSKGRRLATRLIEYGVVLATIVLVILIFVPASDDAGDFSAPVVPGKAHEKHHESSLMHEVHEHLEAGLPRRGDKYRALL